MKRENIIELRNFENGHRINVSYRQFTKVTSSIELTAHGNYYTTTIYRKGGDEPLIVCESVIQIIGAIELKHNNDKDTDRIVNLCGKGNYTPEVILRRNFVEDDIDVDGVMTWDGIGYSDNYGHYCEW